MKRTTKRHSPELNNRKWQTVVEIAIACARQKDRFLVDYGRPSVFARYVNHRGARDELVAAGYEGSFGLQARVKALLLDRFSRRVERWRFDFLPEQANLDILAEMKIERPSTVPGKI
jgi:hypothetical protein